MCVSLNGIAPHKLIGSVIIGRVVFLEKVCPCEVGFEVSYAQAMTSVSDNFLLTVGQEVEFLALSPVHVCQHTIRH